MAPKRKGRGRASAKKQEQVEIDEPDSPVELSTVPARKSLPVPDDIVLEICTHAHPLDMLYLARTCVTLHGVLFHRSSIVAWKQTFRNVGLPLCPDDIAAPRYAALFFETVCDSCRKARGRKGQKDVFWDMRLRLCVKCAWNLVDVPAKCAGLQDGQLRSIVPTSHRPGQTYGKVYEPLLKKNLEIIRGFLDRSPAPTAAEIAAFITSEQAKLSRIETLSRVADKWNEAAVQKELLREDTEIRQASVCSRLEDEGWGDQLNLCREYVLEHELVALPERLFHDDWLLIREQIKQECMSKWTTVHERKALRRRKLERYQRWAHAMYTLGRLEDNPAFYDGGIWPDGNDLRRMPLLQPILNGTAQASQDLPSAEATAGESSAGDVAKDATVHNTAKSLPIRAYEDEGDDYHSESGSEDSFLPPGLRDGEYYSDDDLPVEDDDNLDPGGTSNDSDSEGAGDNVSSRDGVSAAMRRVFPEALAAWRRHISLRLFDSLPKHAIQTLVGDIDLTSAASKIAFLSRAATVFECDGAHGLFDSYSCCGAKENSFLTYPEALKHREVCVLDNLDRLEHFESGFDGPYECQSSMRIRWSPRSLLLSEQRSVFVQGLVVASGLDHRTATRRETHKADARFVCKTCLGEPDDKEILVHNWLSCVENALATLSHGKKGTQHHPDFVRLTDTAEARARELAPCTDSEEPLSVTLSDLGLPRDSLILK